MGDTITSFVHDDSGLVCNIEFLDHDEWVYGITVANNHNFYISQSGFLVHNMAVSVAVPLITKATFVTVVETGAVLGLVAKWIYNFWSTGSFKSAHSSSKKSSSQGNNSGSSNQ